MICKCYFFSDVGMKFLITSRLATGVFIILKLCYIYLASGKIEIMIAELTEKKNKMKVNKSNFNIMKYLFYFSITLVVSVYDCIDWYVKDYRFIYSEKFYWFFSLTRDSTECDFICNIFRDINCLLISLNRKFETILQQIEGIQKECIILKLNILRDLEAENIDHAISSLKMLSCSHWQLIEMVKEFGFVLSLSITLQLIKNFGEIINNAYDLLLFFNGDGRGSLNMVIIYLIFFMQQSASLIDSWVTCLSEVSIESIPSCPFAYSNLMK